MIFKNIIYLIDQSETIDDLLIEICKKHIHFFLEKKCIYYQFISIQQIVLENYLKSLLVPPNNYGVPI